MIRAAAKREVISCDTQKVRWLRSAQRALCNRLEGVSLSIKTTDSSEVPLRDGETHFSDLSASDGERTAGFLGERAEQVGTNITFFGGD